MSRILLSFKCLLLIAIGNSCAKDDLGNGGSYLFYEYETSDYATIIEGEEYFFLQVCCPTYFFDDENNILHREKTEGFNLNGLRVTMGTKYKSRGGAGVHPGGDASKVHDFYSIPTSRQDGFGFSVTKIMDIDGTILLTYDGYDSLVDPVIFLRPGEEWVTSVTDTVSEDYYIDGQIKTTTAEITTTTRIVNHGFLRKSGIVF